MPEYSHVEVIVTTGDVKTTFDLPRVENFNMDPEFDEPHIRLTETKYVKPPNVKQLTFTMRPLRDDDGKYMTITRIAKGVANNKPKWIDRPEK